MMRRKGRGDTRPGNLLTLTELARECGVDLTTIRAYVKSGDLTPDYTCQLGRSYFSRAALPDHVERVTHVKATNIALRSGKAAQEARSRARDEHGRMLPRVVHDEGKSLPAASIGGAP